MFEAGMIIKTSSAYLQVVLIGVTAFRSEAHTIKVTGPNADPRMTPALIRAEIDILDKYLVQCFLSPRK